MKLNKKALKNYHLISGEGVSYYLYQKKLGVLAVKEKTQKSVVNTESKTDLERLEILEKVKPAVLKVTFPSEVVSLIKSLRKDTILYFNIQDNNLDIYEGKDIRSFVKLQSSKISSEYNGTFGLTVTYIKEVFKFLGISNEDSFTFYTGNQLAYLTILQTDYEITLCKVVCRLFDAFIHG